MITTPMIPDPAEPPIHVEWPTLLVALAVYASWLALTGWHAAIPWPVQATLGGLLIAWHGSLQHETIHGHPTRSRAVNAAIGSVPLSLWLPYSIYRASHLAHHATRRITDPHADPESQYHARAGGWRYWLARMEAPLATRLLLGPPARIALFLGQELKRAWQMPSAWARDWLPHLLAVVAVLWWLDRVGLPIATYVLTFVYPGTALSLLRSFAEHRADDDPARRAAIVLKPGLFGLLFLNNNLHAVHHARPGIAWYKLPMHFRSNREAFVRAPVYASYQAIVLDYAWRAQDDVVHPDYRKSMLA